MIQPGGPNVKDCNWQLLLPGSQSKPVTRVHLQEYQKTKLLAAQAKEELQKGIKQLLLAMGKGLYTHAVLGSCTELR